VRRKKEQGYLLIEAVILILTLGLMVPSAISLYTQVLNSYHVSDKFAVATNLAESKMEEILGKVFRAIDDDVDDTNAWVQFAAPYNAYSYAVIVRPIPAHLPHDPDPTMDRFKEVVVSVSHSGITADVVLRTQVSDYNAN